MVKSKAQKFIDLAIIIAVLIALFYLKMAYTGDWYGPGDIVGLLGGK